MHYCLFNCNFFSTDYKLCRLLDPKMFGTEVDFLIAVYCTTKINDNWNVLYWFQSYKGCNVHSSILAWVLVESYQKIFVTWAKKYWNINLNFLLKNLQQ